MEISTRLNVLAALLSFGFLAAIVVGMRLNRPSAGELRDHASALTRANTLMNRRLTPVGACFILPSDPGQAAFRSATLPRAAGAGASREKVAGNRSRNRRKREQVRCEFRPVACSPIRADTANAAMIANDNAATSDSSVGLAIVFVMREPMKAPIRMMSAPTAATA